MGGACIWTGLPTRASVEDDDGAFAVDLLDEDPEGNCKIGAGRPGSSSIGSSSVPCGGVAMMRGLTKPDGVGGGPFALVGSLDKGEDNVGLVSRGCVRYVIGDPYGLPTALFDLTIFGRVGPVVAPRKPSMEEPLSLMRLLLDGVDGSIMLVRREPAGDGERDWESSRSFCRGSEE